MGKTYQEINEKIRKGKAVVLTAKEAIELAKREGVKALSQKADVVTTATFGPMCSSGVFLNFGHSDPQIKMQKVTLNDVPCHAGLAAVDVYLGATEFSNSRGIDYGGAHVIEDLVRKKKIKLKATAYATDCYPRKEIETNITLDSVNQAVMFNPRNSYQNYAVAVNSSNRILYTYMGTLLPKFGNATFCNASELSPLIKDPLFRTIGIGTRIFLCGAEGYVAWEGTQHNPAGVERDPKTKIPYTPSGTLSVIGDLKQMTADYLRAAVFQGYGVSLFVGIGIPIPILDEAIAKSVAVSDDDIYATVVDYSVPKRTKPKLKKVSYRELRSGIIEIDGKKIPTASISSYERAIKITEVLKDRIEKGKFLLQEPIQMLSTKEVFKPLEG